MYERHFGLSRRPFCATAQDETVFVGHQVSALTAATIKALSASDAVIFVSAAVGCGKSTAVRHALLSMGEAVNIVSIDRLLRQSDEILESALEQLGAETVPPGAVQRIKLLREKLANCERNDIRTVFVVEDAARTGADTLFELEALTAADNGAFSGAAIVVMGDSALDEVLSSALLTRLSQRLRLRYNIKPFSRDELQSYLTHWMQIAGAELHDIFEPGCQTALHSTSRGVPRVINRIADAAMTEAAERGLEKVTVDLIERAAACEPDLSGETEHAATLSASGCPAGTPFSESDGTDSGVPAHDAGAHQGPEHSSSHTNADAEHFSESSQSRPEPAAANLPEWDREPTLAQLRPDIEALEKAMAVDKPGVDTSDDEPEIPVLTETSESLTETTTEVMPEITLDREIQATIEEATEDIKRAEAEAAAKAAADAEAEKTIDLATTGELTPEVLAATPRDDASDTDAAAAEKSTTPGNRPDNTVAAVSGHAPGESGDDEQMVDSEFGAVFSDIAAEIVGNPNATPANENLRPGEAELVETCEIDHEAFAPDIDAGLSELPKPCLDEEASKRLATVRALNGLPDVNPNRFPSMDTDALANGDVSSAPMSSEDDIDTIEVQIGSSMTQKIKALNIEDEECENSRKFAFSRRFRKS